MVLFGEVDEMEVTGESSGHLLGSFERPRCHQLLGIALVPIIITRLDHRPPQLLNVTEQRGAAVIGDHLAENIPQQPHVPAERLGDLLTRELPPPVQGRGAFLSTSAGQAFAAVLDSCAYSNESMSAASEASMMLLEQPTVVHRLRPLPDSTRTRVVAAVPAAPSRIRTL